MNYEEFLDDKAQVGSLSGFDPVWMPEFLFDFQKSLCEWAIRKGRAAVFADCGLGKTPMQLVYAQNIVQKTNGRVLLLTPLSVSHQTAKEAEKFQVEAKVSRDGGLHCKIIITNYERLHYFNPNDFEGIVCDESSAIKNFDGKTKEEVTAFARKIQYRLLCTATAAPNDYIELGTSSEALGDLGYMDMLSRFFKSDQNSNHPNRNWSGGAKFRFRGHSQSSFWKWVCSWARACRKPSDIGFSDERFQLPSLNTVQHIAHARTRPEGFLFDIPAHGLKEQRDERRRTINERCEMTAKLVSESEGSSVSWCNLNNEGDLLEKLIPGAAQVSGSDSDDKKEEIFEQFAKGEIKKLVTKSVIAGFGLNWQHCSHQTFFPSHSFEQWYQAIRRSWRFGQTQPVTIDVITTDGEASILNNLKRKTVQAEEMFTQLVELMNDELHIEKSNQFTKSQTIPSWLKK